MFILLHDENNEKIWVCMALCLRSMVTVTHARAHTPYYSCVEQSKCPLKVG